MVFGQYTHQIRSMLSEPELVIAEFELVMFMITVVTNDWGTQFMRWVLYIGILYSTERQLY